MADQNYKIGKRDTALGNVQKFGLGQKMKVGKTDRIFK